MIGNERLLRGGLLTSCNSGALNTSLLLLLLRFITLLFLDYFYDVTISERGVVCSQKAQIKSFIIGLVRYLYGFKYLNLIVQTQKMTII